MQASLDHVLTSHAGSLPRPDGLIEDLKPATGLMSKRSRTR